MKIVIVHGIVPYAEKAIYIQRITVQTVGKR